MASMNPIEITIIIIIDPLQFTIHTQIHAPMASAITKKYEPVLSPIPLQSSEQLPRQSRAAPPPLCFCREAQPSLRCNPAEIPTPQS
ncbi:hypothetical protein M0R45_009764 [Rubus argutus]|uniref:Uncharacterized protein n=1 Tax=Rubus argutus TaxID=59490 RepID=A0AAW1Y7B1_RUBAR